MTDAPAPWARLETALALLAIDPAGLGGLWLRARSGPVRDLVTGSLASLPLPLKRLHPTVADDALYGGLDLAATLATGHPVTTKGLLSAPAALVLAMAERCPAGLAARLASALDGASHALVALDEGAEADESLPPALADRLALFLDLSGAIWSDVTDPAPDPDRLAAARAALPRVALPETALADLTRAAAELGIASLRAPLLAATAARAHAAWQGRDTVADADLVAAAELVYAHRATPMPEAQDTTQDAPPPPDDPADRPEAEAESDSMTIPSEMLVEAALAALPPDLLQALASGRNARAAKSANGTGAEQAGNRRGRPLPSRPGRLAQGARIDLVATLRAAAPWQPLRRAQTPRPDAALLVRASDIRLKRFRETSDRVLIFAVDASGSAAFARLAEAKGAIELLLAAAYARRDHVALLAFRGAEAELILPPTRSLVQTKRRLAGVPGGGGTPLASALQLALATAAQAKARGLTPTIAILTDGRGNIALDGSADRTRAEDEARRLARQIRASGTPALVIDVATRPQAGLRLLAQDMAAPYIALPRADAHRLSATLGAALDG
ncbi:magnesium chelatase subunit D [Paragemmobacter straminiformis]|uniref:Mg-protoporphyrin IX chelatase n=1 Tax=Paragemmobacter straminiformis TaxID=2045119 RepID=A0A842ICB3_9RHOB|nr:magnesium chelatase subunit D [Gemmobacter straminiformis]MBC2836628.1 magnesium chelatase subunit D [Gemmobacter straminiformis]